MEEFAYESFSDWEPFEQQSGDDTPQPTTAAPLSFVLVEDNEPEAPPKRKSLTRPLHVAKKRRTHQHPPPDNRIPPAALPRKATTHNAEIDVGVPVYDYNDRIPRHDRAHSSPPGKSAHANFTPKRTSAAAKSAHHSTPETPAAEQRRTEAAIAEQRPLSRVATTPTARRNRRHPLPIASKLRHSSEPNKDGAVRVNTHVSPAAKSDRAVQHSRRPQQRRNSVHASGTQNASSPVTQDMVDEQARCSMVGQTTAPAANPEAHRRSGVPDPAVSMQQVRGPFGTSPPIVGRPSFPHAFAVPTIPHGRQPRFDPSSMNRLGPNATSGNDHGVPNSHFRHGGPHLGQVPDERVHGLPPETILQMNRFPPPPFLPMPPMTSMMGYQGQLSLQPNFLAQVPQIVVNPFLQSPGGSMYPHQSTHFDAAMGGVPISCNPFCANPPAVSRPGHEGPSFPSRPIVTQANLEGRPSNEDTTRMQPKNGSEKNTEKPPVSSDSDVDVNAKAANKDACLKKSKKQSAKKQQTKTAQVSSLNGVDAIPCEEEEDGVDYISYLNQIPHKKKFFVLSNPRFEQVNVRSKGGSAWRCIMSAELVNKSPPEVIETTAVGRSQKRAKKAAAKQLLSSLKSNVPELFSTAQNGKQNVQAIRSQTALNALNQLVREGYLPSQPTCKTEEVSERDEVRWRCSATLVTKDQGRKVFAEYASSKASAKQKWARKALEILIELKSPGAEQYRYITEPERTPAKKTFASTPRASEVIARTSDDENSNASCDDIVDEMDYSLELPSDYELIVAKTELDCERWFEAHAQPGAELGAFIDSKLARLSVDESFTSEHDNDSEQLKRPILCFSTANSCIVIRIDAREASENESNLDEVEEMFWVPEVVAKVLEDPRVQKAAIGGDDGLDLLSEHHGIQCESIQDISVSSLAIAGYGRVGDSHDLSSLKELTKYWIRKEAKVTSWDGIWPTKRPIVEKLLGGDDKEVALAVLSAYATFCVREKVCDAARMRRMNAPGPANDLEVLSRRIVEVGSG